jgi:hypothetical protein
MGKANLVELVVELKDENSISKAELVKGNRQKSIV